MPRAESHSRVTTANERKCFQLEKRKFKSSSDHVMWYYVMLMLIIVENLFTSKADSTLIYLSNIFISSLSDQWHRNWIVRGAQHSWYVIFWNYSPFPDLISVTLLSCYFVSFYVIGTNVSTTGKSLGKYSAQTMSSLIVLEIKISSSYS